MVVGVIIVKSRYEPLLLLLRLPFCPRFLLLNTAATCAATNALKT